MDHAPVCAKPEVALRVLEQTTDGIAWQTIFSRKVVEVTAIKATETSLSSDPQGAIAIFYKIGDSVIYQPVFNPVKFKAIFGMPACEALVVMGEILVDEMKIDIAPG